MMRIPPGAVLLDPAEVDYVVRALEEFVSAMEPRSPSPRLLVTIQKLRRAGVSADAASVTARADDLRQPPQPPAQTASVRDPQRDSVHAGPHDDIGTAEAARRLGITPNGVRDLARRGRLDVRRAGHRLLVSAASVNAHAARTAARRGR